MKPICFFDLETTGTKIGQDKIVEIAIDKYWQKNSPPQQFHSLINPGIPIPAEATEIHGISDDDVKDKPFFKDVANQILEIIFNSDLAGYNSNTFDIPFIYSEILLSGHTINLNNTRFLDVAVIYKRMEGRTLSDAVEFFLGREHTGAHGASSDTMATKEVFDAMRLKYPEIEAMGMEELNLYCNYDNNRADIDRKFIINADGEYVINFGNKYRGELARANRGYLEWMMRQDFKPDTLAICKKLLDTANFLR